MKKHIKKTNATLKSLFEDGAVIDIPDEDNAVKSKKFKSNRRDDNVEEYNKSITRKRLEKKKLTGDDVERLSDIEDEIAELMKEATAIVMRSKSSTTQSRYRGYVKSHIEMALSHDHEWMAENSSTLRSIIDELGEEVDDEVSKS